MDSYSVVMITILAIVIICLFVYMGKRYYYRENLELQKEKLKQSKTKYDTFKHLSKARYFTHKLNEDYEDTPITFMSTNDSNICICMHGTIDMYPHYSKSVFINYHYAENGGYDFLAVYDNYESDSFVRHVFKTYPQYDYLLYLDDSSYVFNFNQKIEDLIDKMGEKSMLVSKDCKGKVLETPFILYKDMMTLNKMTVEYGDFVTEMGKCDKKNKKYINPFIKRHPDKGGMKDMKYFKKTIKTSKKLKDLQQQVKTRALKRVEENPDIAKDNLSGVSVYYINLARSLDRFGWMKTQEKDLNISLTRLEAVDGKKLTSITNGKYTFEDESVLKYRTIPEGSESIYEIACTLSHLNAIKTAYDNGDEAALILEDDVNLYTIPLWDTTLQEIIDNAPDNWGMLHIGQMHTNLDTGVYKQKHDWGLFAYILKRDIMKMILDITYDVSNNQMDLSYGDLVSNGSTLVSDWYISSYVHKLKRMYLTRPYIVPLNSETLNSTIHNEHTNTHQQQCFDILKSFNVIEKYTRSIPKTIHQI